MWCCAAIRPAATEAAKPTTMLTAITTKMETTTALRSPARSFCAASGDRCSGDATTTPDVTPLSTPQTPRVLLLTARPTAFLDLCRHVLSSPAPMARCSLTASYRHSPFCLQPFTRTSPAVISARVDPRIDTAAPEVPHLADGQSS